MTYLLGTGEDQNEVDILTKMASQEGYNPHYGNVTSGTYTLVNDPKRLRTEMGSYYNFFSQRRRSKDAVITVPYVDAFSKDLIISVLLPVYYNDSFIGVVGTDINMFNVLEDVTYFRRGETSFAFLINGNGRLMSHPLLPTPEKLDEPPVFVHAADIEYKAASRGVIDSMIRGESGFKSFDTDHVLSRGSRAEGVRTFKIHSHYYWHPIPGSNCSVCIVINDKDTRSFIKASYLDTSKKFLYGPYVEKSSTTKQCGYFNKVARTDTSAVTFSPFALLHPLTNLGDQDQSTIEAFMRKEKNAENPGFKIFVREAVVATNHAEDFWLNDTTTNDTKSVVWQLFGTFGGVLRVYPAVTLPRTYDFTQKTWFKRTVGNRGLYVVAAPHEDKWGAGNVVTISNTIFHGKPDQDYAHDDRIAGVMATEFTVPYLYKKMMESNNVCTLKGYGCFIMDTSGFIVMHKTYVDDDVKNVKLKPRHVVEMIPWVGQILIDKNILSRKGCIDYKTVRVYNTWRASLPRRFKHRDKYDKTQLVLDIIADTNLFLGIYNTTLQETPKCPCSVQEQLVECTATCQCPCYLNAKSYYRFCANRFNPSSDSQPTCSPVTSTTGEKFHDKMADSAKQLKQCVDNRCHQRAIKSECYVLTGCKWCPSRNNTKSKCLYYNESCDDITSEGHEVRPLVIGLAVGGSLVGILLITVIVLIVIKVHRRGVPRQTAATSTGQIARIYTSNISDTASIASSQATSAEVTTDRQYSNEAAPTHLCHQCSRCDSLTGIDNPALDRSSSQEGTSSQTRVYSPIRDLDIFTHYSQIDV